MSPLKEIRNKLQEAMRLNQKGLAGLDLRTLLEDSVKLLEMEMTPRPIVEWVEGEPPMLAPPPPPPPIRLIKEGVGSVEGRGKSRLTTDPEDSRLTHGVDSVPVPQAEAYLVLSEEERAKGFVRPLRDTYRHTGIRPMFSLRDLDEAEKEKFKEQGYVSYEKYPESFVPRVGKYWTKAMLDNSGCGDTTTMNSKELVETYARDPHFYGGTYCATCCKHLPVGEFVWMDGERVGS